MGLIFVILEVAIEAAIIVTVSLSLSNNSFWIHSLICVIICIVSGILGLYRNEDRMMPGSGNRRYFMTLGHATIWAYFIGIIIMFAF